MPNILAKTLIAAFVGLGAIATSVPAASASDTGIRVETVGYRNGFQLAFHEPHHRWDRRGRCNLRLAEAKARDRGLRRARVVDVSPRRVVVDGRRFGDRVRMVFANVRGCPTIRR
ncbi:MAG: hypothetical protein QHC90_13670 [Shinella sp.]|nr:hypothetical protein [Shinella sp.]